MCLILVSYQVFLEPWPELFWFWHGESILHGCGLD